MSNPSLPSGSKEPLRLDKQTVDGLDADAIRNLIVEQGSQMRKQDLRRLLSRLKRIEKGHSQNESSSAVNAATEGTISVTKASIEGLLQGRPVFKRSKNKPNTMKGVDRVSEGKDDTPKLPSEPTLQAPEPEKKSVQPEEKSILPDEFQLADDEFMLAPLDEDEEETTKRTQVARGPGDASIPVEPVADAPAPDVTETIRIEDLPQFLSTQQAARVLHMSEEELDRMAQNREVRVFTDNDGWGFRKADVLELARRRGVLPSEEPSYKKPSSDFELTLDPPDVDTSPDVKDPEAELHASDLELSLDPPAEQTAVTPLASEEPELDFDERTGSQAPQTARGLLNSVNWEGHALTRETVNSFTPEQARMILDSDEAKRLHGDERVMLEQRAWDPRAALTRGLKRAPAATADVLPPPPEQIQANTMRQLLESLGAVEKPGRSQSPETAPTKTKSPESSRAEPSAPNGPTEPPVTPPGTAGGAEGPSDRPKSRWEKFREASPIKSALVSGGAGVPAGLATGYGVSAFIDPAARYAFGLAAWPSAAVVLGGSIGLLVGLEALKKSGVLKNHPAWESALTDSTRGAVVGTALMTGYSLASAGFLFSGGTLAIAGSLGYLGYRAYRINEAKKAEKKEAEDKKKKEEKDKAKKENGTKKEIQAAADGQEENLKTRFPSTETGLSDINEEIAESNAAMRGLRAQPQTPEVLGQIRELNTYKKELSDRKKDIQKDLKTEEKNKKSGWNQIKKTVKEWAKEKATVFGSGAVGGVAGAGIATLVAGLAVSTSPIILVPAGIAGLAGGSIGAYKIAQAVYSRYWKVKVTEALKDSNK